MLIFPNITLFMIILFSVQKGGMMMVLIAETFQPVDKQPDLLIQKNSVCTQPFPFPTFINVTRSTQRLGHQRFCRNLSTPGDICSIPPTIKHPPQPPTTVTPSNARKTHQAPRPPHCPTMLDGKLVTGWNSNPPFLYSLHLLEYFTYVDDWFDLSLLLGHLGQE